MDHSNSTFENCELCPNRVVCRCLNVTEEQIVNAIMSHDLRTIRDIRRQTCAGEGCTCCHKELQAIIERVSLGVVEV